MLIKEKRKKTKDEWKKNQMGEGKQAEWRKRVQNWNITTKRGNEKKVNGTIANESKENEKKG